MPQPRSQPRSTEPEPRIFLQPIAAPSSLGLLCYAGAKLLGGAYFVGWLGQKEVFEITPLLLGMGGLLQVAAAMWAFKARDALAASMHAIWGAHWFGFAALQFLVMAHVIAQPSLASPVFGWWYLVLGGLTVVGAIAATGENAGVLSTMTLLTGGCAVMGIGGVTGSHGLVEAAGYVFIASAGCAWYTALALTLEDVYGRPVLPTGRFPAARKKQPITSGLHEPGVTRGQ